MNSNTQTMKLDKRNSKTNNAASRKRHQVLSEILAPSTMAFLQKVPFKKGMHGLDLGCGTGDNTMLLKTLIGSEGKMTGMDTSAFHIRIAKERAIQNEVDNIDYRHQNMLEWKEDEVYDFIYSGLLFNQLPVPLNILKQMYRSLKPGGYAMVEDLDYSEFHCFPNCYAFDRFVGLFTEIKKQQGTDANIGNHLNRLFQQAGFNKIQAQLVPPNFLKGKTKHIASLTLESIAPLLLEEKRTTPTELQALIFELKNFEEQKNTMITLPGIYQVVGYR